MTSGLRVLVIGNDPAFALAVSEILAAQFPEALSDRIDAENVRARPDASANSTAARMEATSGALGCASDTKHMSS